MKKYSFKNDYSEGAHPRILEALMQNNFQQEEGYSNDDFCKKAADAIRKEIKNNFSEIFFVSGGTQANLIVMAAALKPFESVIAANSGHISLHEAGAIEATGHKINIIESDDGKIKATEIEEIVLQHQDDPPHMVVPKLVYISQSTELGTIYSKSEVDEISKICKKHNLYLYVDGARLGVALTSSKNDLSIEYLLARCDAICIGGAKNGALLGEAIVVNNKEISEYFKNHMKQRGALVGKSRIFGIQFLEFFKDGLYYETAKHANKMAEKLKNGIEKAGFGFLTESYTNQIFPIFPKEMIKTLEENFEFYHWKEVDKENLAIRLVTSWATKEEKVDKFLSYLD